MADGISKGIGEQLGNLGKQIAVDVAKTPAKIVGLDETVGQGTGGKGNKRPQKPQGQGLADKLFGNPRSPEEIQALAQQDEAYKNQKMTDARRLLQQISAPSPQNEPSIYEKIQKENEQKKQLLLDRKNASSLPMMTSKPKRGNLFGRKQAAKSKAFGGEMGKNVKSG